MYIHEDHYDCCVENGLEGMLLAELYSPKGYAEVSTPREAVFGRGTFKEMHECVLGSSVVSNSLRPHGL